MYDVVFRGLVVTPCQKFRWEFEFHVCDTEVTLSEKGGTRTKCENVGTQKAENRNNIKMKMNNVNKTYYINIVIISLKPHRSGT